MMYYILGLGLLALFFVETYVLAESARWFTRVPSDYLKKHYSSDTRKCFIKDNKFVMIVAIVYVSLVALGVILAAWTHMGSKWLNVMMAMAMVAVSVLSIVSKALLINHFWSSNKVDGRSVLTDTYKTFLVLGIVFQSIWFLGALWAMFKIWRSGGSCHHVATACTKTVVTHSRRKTACESDDEY